MFRFVRRTMQISSSLIFRHKMTRHRRNQWSHTDQWNYVTSKSIAWIQSRDSRLFEELKSSTRLFWKFWNFPAIWISNSCKHSQTFANSNFQKTITADHVEYRPSLCMQKRWKLQDRHCTSLGWFDSISVTLKRCLASGCPILVAIK